ncbi:hypothetical protein [Paenibacillus eucommiae]|uniref:YgiT-type zinc finger protein n=1 Tax=Paenibacillus eucommiae TaxID=1355755 RepID=A0ABS4ISN3_9BACL|nr:hypothetical protein [Paenibacillus eucommiae]MBP1990579.1 hypothetical protein [Paenibacillus eucommiae]
MSVKRYCEECRIEQTCRIVEKPAIYEFRGQKIEISQRMVICTECESKVYDDELDSETMVTVARVYAEKYGLTVDKFALLENNSN